MVREDIDTDEFIDVLLGNRKYLQCLYVRPPFEFDSSFPPPLFRRAEPLSSRFPFLLSRQVYNKIDSIPLEEVDRLSRQPMSLAISCELSLKWVSLFLFLSPVTFVVSVLSFVGPVLRTQLTR